MNPSGLALLFGRVEPRYMLQGFRMLFQRSARASLTQIEAPPLKLFFALH